MRAVSLFSGAGGMDVGFKRAGFDVVWANEIDADAASTYQRNNPGAVMRQSDINAVKSEISKYKHGFIDMVFGGPPCQGFSVAGKMNPDDERSKLIWEFFNVVKILKPKIFVMENVKALGKLEKWKSIREKIGKCASDMGYSCLYTVLNAADYGVPQKRERVFFIGFLDTELFIEKIFMDEVIEQRKPRVSLRQCLNNLPNFGSEGNPVTCTAKITLAASPVMRKSPYAGMMFNGLGRPMDLDNQSNTLPASMGGNKTPIIDEMLLKNPEADDWIVGYHKSLSKGDKPDCQIKVPTHIRRITTVEAAAIQTFPPEYKFTGGKSSIYRQIGNAVPCNLAEAVAKATVEVYKTISSESQPYNHERVG